MNFVINGQRWCQLIAVIMSEGGTGIDTNNKTFISMKSNWFNEAEALKEPCQPAVPQVAEQKLSLFFFFLNSTDVS